MKAHVGKCRRGDSSEAFPFFTFRRDNVMAEEVKALIAAEWLRKLDACIANFLRYVQETEVNSGCMFAIIVSELDGTLMAAGSAMIKFVWTVGHRDIYHGVVSTKSKREII